MTLPGLFVTGTDTGVGKTWVAAAMARALASRGMRPGLLKPVATSAASAEDGTWASPDTLILREALGGSIPLERITPLALPGDLAPCVAARSMGRMLTQEEVLRGTLRAVAWWSERADVLVVEGVGGLLCPLAEGSTVADLAVALDYPLVIVARLGLGTLNHTMLTVEAARHRGLRIAGVVLNESGPPAGTPAEATNPGELARRLGPVPLLAISGHRPDASAMCPALRDVDWYERSRPPRLPPSAPEAAGARG